MYCGFRGLLELELEKAFFGKYLFKGEMKTRSQTKTLLQIFCELSLYSQVIYKSMKVADDLDSVLWFQRSAGVVAGGGIFLQNI